MALERLDLAAEQVVVFLDVSLTAEPIEYLDGQAFFCRVTLEDVFVPEDMLLGRAGDGWAQNTSELAFERAGPERWLSTYLLVEQLLREGGVDNEGGPVVLGEAVEPPRPAFGRSVIVYNEAMPHLPVDALPDATADARAR